MGNCDGVVTEADVRAAQVVLDLIAEAEGTQRALNSMEATRGLLLDLRGVLAAQLAEVRTAGYLEGLQAGRRTIGQLVRETLEGEGL